jgi:prepilin-type N-terminal cleavage/methylation domain-containing protein
MSTHASRRLALRSRRGFTLIELLVVIAIISIIAGLIVPVLIQGRIQAQITQCSSNLRQIGTFSMMYADKRGSGWFPFARDVKEPRAHESLNELVRFDFEALDPRLFVCAGWPHAPATADDEGKFVLDEETLAYAYVARRTKSTSRKPLASDKYHEGFEDSEGVHSEGHRGGMNVVLTDGSVHFLEKDQLRPETGLPADLTR